MESTNSRLNKYMRVINFDDFVDFLYSQKVIDEKKYYEVWSKGEKDRIYSLFESIDSHNDEDKLEKIFSFLKKEYPNVDRIIEDENKYRLASVRGGFPRLPPNYVTRKTLVENVKRKLLELTWEKKLVIHGMMGYGKSCLINEVVHTNPVLKYFDHHVFWINLGDCHSKENVWQPMWRLYTAASSITENKISHCHVDIERLKDSLIRLFMDEKLQNSLVILDDACSEDVLTYFDIRCKTVITTQNRNILRNEDADFVAVNFGFSLEESLDLFKTSLKTSTDLPVLAEEVHHICQGHPMLIALIGSYLNENSDMAKGSGNDLWVYIKTMLRRGNYRLNEFNTDSNISEIVRKCIEKLLTGDLKTLYHDLAIFSQDVNIPPAVLEVLWNKSSHEVRNVMNKLAEKSLVVPFYHDNLQTYIYGIHELLLNSLREQTKEQTVALHRKLISGYDRITGGDYSKLPDDNYTLQFIGYHLSQAEQFDKFDVYFNLKFLEAKIRAVGKEDVLRDMEKYGKYITKHNNLLEEKLEQYRDFVSRCGCHLYSYERTDILQYALRESRDSMLFKDALEVAKGSRQLYFQLQKPVDEPDHSQIMKIKDNISSACFVDSPHHILIGTTEGKIKLFYEQSPKEISAFVGHQKAIRTLVVSPDKRYFLSVSEDGVVFLWKFSADSSRNSMDFSGQCPVSPKTKQPYWQDMHTADKGQILPRKKFQAFDLDDLLVSAAFCYDFPDQFVILTGSSKGNVVVWDALNGTPICNTGNRGMAAPCVMYVQDRGERDAIIFSCDDSIFKYHINGEGKLSYAETLFNKDTCCSIFYAEEELVTVSDRSITVWKNHKSDKVLENFDDTKKNISSTITSDGQYVVVSTSQSTVYIWDLEEKKLLMEFENRGLAKSLDTFYDEDKSVHVLLIGSDRNTLQLCHIQPYNDREPQVDAPVFASHWKRKNPLTAIRNADNRIQIFSGYVQVSETEQPNSLVTCVCFSPCGNNIVYGLINGEIRMFNIKTKKEVTIEEPLTTNGQKHPVNYLHCYDPSGLLTARSYSNGSTDSLDLKDFKLGCIVSHTGNSLLRIRNEEKIFKLHIVNPLVFYASTDLILVDRHCGVSVCNVDTGRVATLQNGHILEEVMLNTAEFSVQKCLLALSFEQPGKFLDIYALSESYDSMQLLKRLDLRRKVKSLRFSTDASLLVAGFASGDISIWNLNEKYKHTTLDLHSGPVEILYFSPNVEPILVSLGEEIAWWNLKHLQKGKKVKGRPKSILDGATACLWKVLCVCMERPSMSLLPMISAHS
nr:unnamed protein product [Callosobruchus chinensis]